MSVYLEQVNKLSVSFKEITMENGSINNGLSEIEVRLGDDW